MKRIIFFLFFSLCLSLAFSQDRDKPQKGEGIYAFLKRNNRTEAKHYMEFLQLNKDKLGKSNTLKIGVTYVLPPRTAATPVAPAAAVSSTPSQAATNTATSNTPASRQAKTGTNPIFGEKYKTYEIIDNSLAGACFYVVSGHGGPDPGAIAKVDGRQLHEDEYAYDISLRLARNLLQHGATVHIIIQDPKDGIRDGKYLNNSKNETCLGQKIPLNQVKRLEQRASAINRLSAKASEKYQRAIFIHLDSRSTKTQLDVFFYYQDRMQTKAQSLKLAQTMQTTFREKYAIHRQNRGYTGTVSTRPLLVLRSTNPASVLIELANMQNVNDQKRYMEANNRQALANWLCEGLIKDYKSTPR